MIRRLIILSILGLLTTESISRAESPNVSPTDYSNWKNGIPIDPEFFPLAVWVQNPRNAARYKAAGINTYVGLWNGPTEAQLADLKQAGMFVICSQNETALASDHADIIIGWMHGDEPDNAQPLREGGYGPPILPYVIEENYKRIRSRDPSRPVLLNLGQGVAYDDYVGRGVRRNKPEDYPQYLRGCDIASFDIYPAVHDKPEVAGKLEFVANGVERLHRWANHQKIVWNCIECSRISNVHIKPTPAQVRSEVWMSLIRGSRGIIYFVHQFEPSFKEASVFDDPGLLEAMTSLNHQIRELAPVLNSPTVNDAIEIPRSSEKTPIEVMCKRHDGSLYLFIANMSSVQATAEMRLKQDVATNAQIDPIADSSPISLKDATLEIDLQGYGIGLYRVIEMPAKGTSEKREKE